MKLIKFSEAPFDLTFFNNHIAGTSIVGLPFSWGPDGIFEFDNSQMTETQIQDVETSVGNYLTSLNITPITGTPLN